MEKKKWWQNLRIIRRIILVAVNLIAPVIMFLIGRTVTGRYMYLYMIAGEILFIALSLIVYYLSVIAHSVSKMAEISEKEKE